MRHVLTTSDLSFWRAVNAKLIMEHGEAPAIAGEIKPYLVDRSTPKEAAAEIMRSRVDSLEAVL
jgi:hypothetical protein